MLEKRSMATKYPEKPITVIIPFSGGGGMDLTSRSMEKVALKYLGQPLLTMNKPGAAGSIGWNEAASANPDGYTITLATIDIELLSANSDGKYNYITALEPIGQILSFPLILATSSSQPWNNVSELISYAKEHPGKIKFGHWGIGSLAHVTGEMFAHETGVKFGFVPFQGEIGMLTALLGGHVELVVMNPMTAKEYVTQGNLKALAVIGEQRLLLPEFQDVPTLKEMGIDLTCDNWHMVCVPKDLPPDVKTKLVDSFRGIINDPGFRTDTKNRGLDVNYLGPDEAMKKWLGDWEKYSKEVKETGILDEIKSQRK